jgi:hypothetical protein
VFSRRGLGIASRVCTLHRWSRDNFSPAVKWSSTKWKRLAWTSDCPMEPCLEDAILLRNYPRCPANLWCPGSDLRWFGTPDSFWCCQPEGQPLDFVASLPVTKLWVDCARENSLPFQTLLHELSEFFPVVSPLLGRYSRFNHSSRINMQTGVLWRCDSQTCRCCWHAMSKAMVRTGNDNGVWIGGEKSLKTANLEVADING